jgi:hypothetical protein
MIRIEDALREHDYGMMNIAACFVEALGMQAENQDRIQKGKTIAYSKEAFDALIEKHGIHHNAVLTRWSNLQY